MDAHVEIATTIDDDGVPTKVAKLGYSNIPNISKGQILRDIQATQEEIADLLKQMDSLRYHIRVRTEFVGVLSDELDRREATKEDKL